MDRRRFIKSVTGAATAVAASGTAVADVMKSQPTQSGLAAPDTLSGVLTLRVGVAAPESTQGIADFVRQFAARLHAVTENAVLLEFVIVTENSMSAVAAGDVDCYCATDHRHLDVAPELAFFAGLPGKTAMPGDAHQTWLTLGGGQDHWDHVASSFDIKPLAIAHTGPQPYLWSRAPIESLDTLSDKTIIAEGLAADVAQGLGANVITDHNWSAPGGVVGDDIFAGEAGDFPTALAAGFPQSLPYASTPGLNRFGSVVTFGMKKSLWDALPSGQRLLFEAAAAATYQDTFGFAQTHHKLMAKASAEQNGTTYLDLAPEVAAAIARVSDTVVAHLAASSTATRINTSYMAFRHATGVVS